MPTMCHRVHRFNSSVMTGVTLLLHCNVSRLRNLRWIGITTGKIGFFISCSAVALGFSGRLRHQHKVCVAAAPRPSWVLLPCPFDFPRTNALPCGSACCRLKDISALGATRVNDADPFIDRILATLGRQLSSRTWTWEGAER
ncbi:hypothetical protein BDN72DRAFT_341407 [Pluteus cervinus]|uniref:Uncharacterized protein n=1 Tax=Pluteus cervinus TaxID=181527 RepID=A0ACD3ABB1_9AGAR|nr:hypothetical protein BDN72DRAFT_341407 [Pluteus cervinus]